MSDKKVEEFLKKVKDLDSDKSNIRKISDDELRELASEILNSMKLEADSRNDFGMNSRLLDLIIKIKQAWYPATQRNVNTNIDFNKSLEQWAEKQKELMQQRTAGSEVYQIVSEENDN